MVISLVVLVAVAAFALAALVFGRADLTPPQRPEDEPALPEGPLTAEDLDQLRLSGALRGYRMSEVDAVLARLREQLPARDPVPTEPGTGPRTASPGEQGSSATQPPVT